MKKQQELPRSQAISEADLERLAQWYARGFAKPERVHELKCWVGPYEDILKRRKRHEIRNNDRNYLVGDVLVLKEWDPALEDPIGLYKKPKSKANEYTGRSLRVNVTHVTYGGRWDLPNHLCVMSIRLLKVLS